MAKEEHLEILSRGLAVIAFLAAASHVGCSRDVPARSGDVAAPVMISGAKLENGVFASGLIRFRDLFEIKESEAEKSRIGDVLTRYGARNVHWSGVTVTFDNLRIDVIPHLLDDLKYKQDTATAGGKLLMHELVDFGCQLEASYRTADIRAGIDTMLSFKVTRGARLYYVPAPGQNEQEVKVHADGTVSFHMRIARGQDAVYARTELGVVRRYIRVDVFSGDVTDVTEEEYRAKIGR